MTGKTTLRLCILLAALLLVFTWAAAETAENAETSISGSVVARLTMVAPTISFGTPDTSAIQEAAETNKSPPLTMTAIDTARQISATGRLIMGINDGI